MIKNNAEFVMKLIKTHYHADELDTESFNYLKGKIKRNRNALFSLFDKYADVIPDNTKRLLKHSLIYLDLSSLAKKKNKSAHDIISLYADSVLFRKQKWETNRTDIKDYHHKFLSELKENVHSMFSLYKKHPEYKKELSQIFNVKEYVHAHCNLRNFVNELVSSQYYNHYRKEKFSEMPNELLESLSLSFLISIRNHICINSVEKKFLGDFLDSRMDEEEKKIFLMSVFDHGRNKDIKSDLGKYPHTLCMISEEKFKDHLKDLSAFQYEHSKELTQELKDAGVEKFVTLNNFWTAFNKIKIETERSLLSNTIQEKKDYPSLIKRL